jgi:hypothetical protein
VQKWPSSKLSQRNSVTVWTQVISEVTKPRFVPCTQVSYCGRSLAAYVTKLWNGLDVSVRTAPTIGVFKKGLKNTLFPWWFSKRSRAILDWILHYASHRTLYCIVITISQRWPTLGFITIYTKNLSWTFVQLVHLPLTSNQCGFTWGQCIKVFYLWHRQTSVALPGTLAVFQFILALIWVVIGMASPLTWAVIKLIYLWLGQ